MTRKQRVLIGRFIESLNIFNLPKILGKFKDFDPITEFRLINGFTITLAFSMIGPILISLKGTLILPWVLSVFSIAEMISLKTNELIIYTFSLSQIYKITIILHVLYVISTVLYFWSPTVMIYGDLIIGIFDMSILSAYSVALTNYLTDNYPKTMSKFQMVRNNSISDASLIALIVSTILLYYFHISVAIIVFIVINIVFIIWCIYNWDIYDILIEENKHDSNK